MLARNHTEINDISEKIVNYREHKEKYEIEKLLNEKSNMDARFYKMLRYCKYFSYQPQRITLNKEHLEELHVKVSKFRELLAESKLTIFEEDSPEKYKTLLYSTENLLQFHKK